MEVKFLGGEFEGSEFLTVGKVYVVESENDCSGVCFFGVIDDEGDSLPLEEWEMQFFEKV